VHHVNGHVALAITLATCSVCNQRLQSVSNDCYMQFPHLAAPGVAPHHPDAILVTLAAFESGRDGYVRIQEIPCTAVLLATVHKSRGCWSAALDQNSTRRCFSKPAPLGE
jgi:hypothetical protein